MTTERFIEIFENTETEGTGDRCFKGLQIIAKYTDTVICGASHDVVWSEEVSILIENGITEEDVIALAKLNWWIEDNAYLAHFV